MQHYLKYLKFFTCKISCLEKHNFYSLLRKRQLIYGVVEILSIPDRDQILIHKIVGKMGPSKVTQGDGEKDSEEDRKKKRDRERKLRA